MSVLAPPRMWRSRAAATVLAATMVTGWVAVMAASTAAAAPRCANAGQVTFHKGAWVQIRAPKWSAGSPGVTSYAVGPLGPGLMYATNGVAVARTIDGGCTWAEVWAVPTLPSLAMPFSRTTATVTSIVIAYNDRVFVVVNDAGHPHIVSSTDGGGTWATADAGLTSADTGSNAPILVAAPSPNFVYFVAHPAAAVADRVGDIVYVSRDGAKTWTPSPIADVNNKIVHIAKVVVDPAAPESLWAATNVGVLHSTDGGSNWAAAGIGGADPVGTVELVHAPNAQLGIAVFESARPVGYVSADGGTSWTSVTTPAPVRSVATATSPIDVAIATDSGVYRLIPSTLKWFRIRSTAPRLGALTADRTTAPTLWACDCGTPAASIWHYYGPPPTSSLPPDLTIPPMPTPTATAYNQKDCMPVPPKVPDAKIWGPSVLDPVTQQITMAPGQSRTVHYTLRLSPEEMDVLFLEDVGNRTEFSHCPQKWGTVYAANKLHLARNLRVAFGGVADYAGYSTVLPEDTPFFGSNGYKPPQAYERIVDVVRHTKSFTERVASYPMAWEGGGQQGDRGQLAALYQSMTGLGQDVAPPGPSSTDISGGLQANFGDFSYRAVMHVTGDYFNTSDRTPGYPGPSFAQALAALRAKDVVQLGMYVNNKLNKQDSSQYDKWYGRDDLAEVARATGALSNRSIDCDEDGFVDLHRGDPLVCTYTAPPEGDFNSRDITLGISMKNLLMSLKDVQTVRLTALDGASAVTMTSPPSYDGIDLLLPHTLEFDVRLTCGRDASQGTRLVKIGAEAKRHVLATATTLLNCGAPVEPPVHPVAIVFPPPPPPVPQPIPAPHPAPQPAPNPAPNPAQAPQMQAQPVAQGVVVPQQQEQPQVALAKAMNTVQEAQGEHAMVEYRPSRRLPVTSRAGVAFGALCLLTYFAAARQVERAEQRAGDG